MPQPFLRRKDSAGGVVQLAAPGTVPVDRDRPKIKVRLPSNGVFYPDRQGTLTVSPLTVGQIRSIHAATETKVRWEQESTFAAAIQQSVSDFDVLKLTTDDYRFLLYWVRLNSYKNSPYIIEWSHPVADSPDKKMRTQVAMTTFEVLECNPNKQLIDKRLAYPTVSDKLDFYKLDDASEKYIAQYAFYLAGKDLREKISRLEAMPADFLPQLKQHMLDFAHGIVETASLRDPDDGAAGDTYEVALRLQLTDFFP